jgi:hypothetical protein
MIFPVGGKSPYPFGAKYGVFINFDSLFNSVTGRIVNSSIPGLVDMMLDPNEKPCLNGGGDLRLSFDRAGQIRLSLAVFQCVVDATPANRKLELGLGINASSVAYLWWGIPGATQPAETDQYGAKRVYGGPGNVAEYVMINGEDNGTSNIKDYSYITTRSDLTKTAANQPAESTDGPTTPMKSQDFSVANCSASYPYSSKLNGSVAGLIVNFWMKMPSGITGNPILLSRKNNTTDSVAFELSLDSANTNNIDLYDAGGVKRTFSTGINFGDGNWHFINLQFVNNTTPNLFLAFFDTETYNSSITNWVDSTEPLYLGQNGAGTGDPFDGLLSNVRFIDGVYAQSYQLSNAIYQNTDDPPSCISSFNFFV